MNTGVEFFHWGQSILEGVDGDTVDLCIRGRNFLVISLFVKFDFNPLDFN